MSNKIIKPEGIELLNYINDGYAICEKCGALMDRKEDPAGGCDIYVCPSCGLEVDEMEYEYKDEELASDVLDACGSDTPPAGCISCGGPYPSCKTSCKLFDN